MANLLRLNASQTRWVGEWDLALPSIIIIVVVIIIVIFPIISHQRLANSSLSPKQEKEGLAIQLGAPVHVISNFRYMYTPKFSASDQLQTKAKCSKQ